MCLDIAAWFERLICLGEEPVPVLDRTEEPANMYIIDRVMLEGPWLRAVVDLAK